MKYLILSHNVTLLNKFLVKMCCVGIRFDEFSQYSPLLDEWNVINGIFYFIYLVYLLSNGISVTGTANWGWKGKNTMWQSLKNL